VEVVHPRCAGVDISKRDAKVCVRVQGSGRLATNATVTTWGSMTSQILALRDHLIEQKVTCVVMESTGDYWKPFYYLLEDALDVMLVNARDVRNRPGRKTDVLADDHVPADEVNMRTHDDDCRWYSFDPSNIPEGDRHGGSAAPGPLLRRNKPPLAVTVLRTEPGIGGGESSSLAR
jgi:hypothetical protein